MTIEKITSLISKPNEQRGTMEIELLIPFLKRHCEVFRDLERAVLHDIIKNCLHQRAERDDIIVQQGEKGLYMYIMLTGRAAVYIDNFAEDDLPNPEDSMSTKGPVEVQLQKSFDRSTLGKFIIAFEAGKRFGEMALMSEDGVRNASIIADQVVDLLVIDKALFNRTLRTNEEREYQVRKDFINKNPLFGRWSPQLKRLVEMSLRKETYSYNNTVMKQGDPVRGVFFISRGQVNLEVSTSQHNHQYPKMFGNAPDKTVKRKSISRDGISLGSIQYHIRLRRKEGYSASEQHHMNRIQHVCILQDNEILSDIEVILGLDTYLYSAVTTAYTEVYVLELKNFDRLMSRKKYRATDKLKHIVFNKIKRRLDSEKIPIMIHLAEKLKAIMPRGGSRSLLEDVSRTEQLKEEGVERKLVSRRPKSSVLNSPRHWEMLKLKTCLRQSFISLPSPRNDGQPRNLHLLTRVEPLKHTYRRPTSSRKEVLQRPRTAPVGRDDKERHEALDQHSKTPERSLTPRRNRSAVRRMPGLRTPECDPGDGYTSILDFFQISKITLCSKTRTSETISVPMKEDFVDPETNEGALGHLETRLESFYQKLDGQGNVSVHHPAYRLKRFHLEDGERVPSPGGRVLVKSKFCTIPSGAGHKHVRRFVLSQPSDLVLATQRKLPIH